MANGFFLGGLGQGVNQFNQDAFQFAQLKRRTEALKAINELRKEALEEAKQKREARELIADFISTQPETAQPGATGGPGGIAVGVSGSTIPTEGTRPKEQIDLLKAISAFREAGVSNLPLAEGVNLNIRRPESTLDVALKKSLIEKRGASTKKTEEQTDQLKKESQGKLDKIQAQIDKLTAAADKLRSGGDISLSDLAFQQIGDENPIVTPAVDEGRRIRVKKKDTGQLGTILESEFDPNIYERL